MPADDACRTITGADKMKCNKMDEISVEEWWKEIYGSGKREKPREKPVPTPIRLPRILHGTRDSIDGRRML